VNSPPVLDVGNHLWNYYHKTDFGNTTIALIAKSIQFSTNEYSKIQAVDQMDTTFVDFADYDESRDVSNRRKGTKVPQRALETRNSEGQKSTN
jgi:hypothetical protein